MGKQIRITEVGISSLGKLVGTVNAIVALAVGVVASIVTTVGVISNNNYSTLTDILVSIGIVLVGVIVYPLLAFLVGWVYGALIAFVWNVILGVSGGLKIMTEEVADLKPAK